jgi:hypothetical protein
MTIIPRATILFVAVIGAMASADNGSSRQGTLLAPLPRVYVFTRTANSGERTAPDQQARETSVQDLRDVLRRKTRFLEVVDVSDNANLSVEVLSREAPSPKRCVLSTRVRVVGREETRQFQGESRTWQDAAQLVADIVVRFVNETY